MKFKNIIALIMSFTFLNVGTVFAEEIHKSQTLKEVYELKERCGKRAEEYFRKTYAKEDVIRFYENHYNEKMNSCFILETAFIQNEKEKSKILMMKSLSNVNENKSIGAFYGERNADGSWAIVLNTCYVLNITCDSLAEWEKLMKKYMETDNED